MATRESFAFQGAAPMQSRPAASAASRGAQVVGGGGRGEVIKASPVDAGMGAGQLGEFFGGLMEPYVARKQAEKFFEGYTAAASGVAIEELTSSDSPITKIFGPTGFEQGAALYTANTALDTYSSEMLADKDTLKRLPPVELAKVLAEKSRALMTGDSGTNMLIQQGLIERMGPVMNTVAKARMEWHQSTAVNQMNLAHDAAADNLQKVIVAQVELGETDETKAAVASAFGQFMSGRAIPEGMTEDSYRKYLAASAMSDITAGRFYAVNAMKKAGAWNHLDEETRTKLELAYEKHSGKALTKAAYAIVPDLVALRTAIKTEQVPGGPMGAAREIARLNDKVKRLTGTTEDMFDYKDMSDEAGSVMDVIVASARRAESRRQQLEDIATQRGYQLEDREKDRLEAEAAINTAWATGDVPGYLRAGGDSNSMEARALAEVRAGNVGGILNAYIVGDNWVSKSAAASLQRNVRNSIGDEYNKDVGRSYQQWKSMYAENANATAAYYGDIHAPMQRFHTMIEGGNAPQNAFAKAFGNPAVYNPTAIPAERKATYKAALDAVIDSGEPGMFNFWGTSLNGSSRKRMSKILEGYFGVLATGDHGLSDEQIAKQSEARAKANGTLERYGRFAWGNNPNTKPLSAMVGVQGKEMDDLFAHVLDRQLKKAGVAGGASGDEDTIYRVKTPQGDTALWVEVPDEDGSGFKSTIITVAQLKEQQQYNMDMKWLRGNRTTAERRGGTPASAVIHARIQAHRKAYPIK
jgi:hypothetical protein